MADEFRHPDNDRLFSMRRFLWSNPRPADIVEEPPCGFYSYIDYADERPYVVFIDGACPGNGYSHAKGGYGIYFGSRSHFNVSNPLKPHVPQTSQRAELTACLVALNQIEKFHLDFDDQDRNVYIIASDSAYLVNSLTSFIYTWRQNGYISAAGRPVVHGDLFRRLDHKLDVMRFGRQQIDVLFWKIDRSDNQEADELAREGARCYS